VINDGGGRHCCRLIARGEDVAREIEAAAVLGEGIGLEKMLGGGDHEG